MDGLSKTLRDLAREYVQGLRADLGDALVCQALPEDLAGLLIKCVDLPGMLRIILHRSHIAEQSKARLIFRSAAYCGYHEDLVSPHDGRRV